MTESKKTKIDIDEFARMVVVKRRYNPILKYLIAFKESGDVVKKIEGFNYEDPDKLRKALLNCLNRNKEIFGEKTFAILNWDDGTSYIYRRKEIDEYIIHNL